MSFVRKYAFNFYNSLPFTILLLVPQLAHAGQTYWTDPSGSGPCGDIQTCVDKLQLGDTLELRGGIYDLNAYGGLKIKDKLATSSEPISIKAAAGETPVLTATTDPFQKDYACDGVDPDPNDNIEPETCSVVEIRDSEFVVVEGLSVTNGDASVKLDSLGFRLIDVSFVTIKQSDIHHVGKACLRADSQQFVGGQPVPELEGLSIIENQCRDTVYDASKDDRGRGFEIGCYNIFDDKGFETEGCMYNNARIVGNQISNTDRGINVKVRSHGATISGNLLKSGKGIGILTEGACCSVPLEDPDGDGVFNSCPDDPFARPVHVIEKNIVSGWSQNVNSEAAITTDHGWAVVENNIIYDNDQGILFRSQGGKSRSEKYCGAYQQSFPVAFAGILHNTLVDNNDGKNGDNIRLYDWVADDPGTNTFYYNALALNVSYQLGVFPGRQPGDRSAAISASKDFFVPGHSHNFIFHNLVVGEVERLSGGHYSDSGFGEGNFFDALAGDFYPALSQSPIINVSNRSFTTVDFDGNLRDDRPDAGAYEYVGERGDDDDKNDDDRSDSGSDDSSSGDDAGSREDLIRGSSAQKPSQGGCSVKLSSRQDVKSALLLLLTVALVIWRMRRFSY